LLEEDLPQVDAAWRDWITSAYATNPEAEMIANAWKAHTSWAHYCSAGNEF
jgi:hypothetical protein